MGISVRIPIRSICLLTVLLLSLWWCWEAGFAVAQSDTVTWFGSVNLSNTPQYSGHPAIVADGYGYVHVFWSENVGDVPMESQVGTPQGNSILYTRWDGVSWTPPVDIAFVPGETIAEFVAVDMDAENRLHIVWTGQSNFYYSDALSWQAESAHAWSTPVVLASDSARSSWESDIAADPSGTLHVVYATRRDAPGIYHICSLDGGRTWQPAVRLSDPFGPLEYSFSNVKLVADEVGRLHVVWQTTQAEGFGQAIYYARSTDGGESWSAPVQLGYRDPGDYEASWPYLTAIGASEPHLIYIDGQSSIGRFHRISKDGGETWSVPHHILTDMEGVNGYLVPLVDSAGQLHLMINMRTRAGQVVGIYYARWQGDGWSPVVPVDLSDLASHYLAATVRLGNELHVVWNGIRGGEIWHKRGIVSSATPVSVPVVPSSPTSTPSPPADAQVTPQMPTLIPQSVEEPLDLPGRAMASSTNSNPLVLGGGSAFLLVIVVVVRTRLRLLRN